MGRASPFLCGLRFWRNESSPRMRRRRQAVVRDMRCGSIWVNQLLSGNLRKTYKRNACGKGNQWLIKETNGLFKPLIRPATVFLWGVVWHWGGGSLKFPWLGGKGVQSLQRWMGRRSSPKQHWRIPNSFNFGTVNDISRIARQNTLTTETFSWD